MRKEFVLTLVAGRMIDSATCFSQVRNKIERTRTHDTFRQAIQIQRSAEFMLTQAAPTYLNSETSGGEDKASAVFEGFARSTPDLPQLPEFPSVQLIITDLIMHADAIVFVSGLSFLLWSIQASQVTRISVWCHALLHI